MASKRSLAVAMWVGVGAIVLVLLLELVSIERWSSTSAMGTTVGVIEYRSGLGGLNRVTMTINEVGLWLTGARFTGPSSYGHFDRWTHTYVR